MDLTKILYKYKYSIAKIKKKYVNTDTELNTYQIIEYCYNWLVIFVVVGFLFFVFL